MNIPSNEVFWESESIKWSRAMEQLDEFVFNVTDHEEIIKTNQMKILYIPQLIKI